MNKKHKGKPGFQEYADKVFGGKTTFSGDDGMISTTTKPITAKKQGKTLNQVINKK